MYQFTEDCLIGITQIDEEHRHLFQLINDMMELLQNESADDNCYQIKTLMRELEAYAATHFKHEEAYMERIRDPELALQKREHEQFCDKVAALTISEDSSIEEQKKTLEDMLLYLTKWLYRHILGSDIIIGKMQAVKDAKEPLTFTEKYFTGIELIDEEHRRLFEIIAQAKQLIQEELLHDKYDEIMNILNQLREYTKVHFNDEEEYMKRIDYPLLPAQKRAHDAFVEKLSEINLDEVDENQQSYLEELMEYLVGWLINHIMKADKLIGEFERSK